MIKASTRIGEFTITNGELMTDNKSISVIFSEFSNNEQISPSEGPVDYALAKRLADTLGEGFEVIEQEFDLIAGELY